MIGVRLTHGVESFFFFLLCIVFVSLHAAGGVLSVNMKISIVTGMRMQ